MQTVSTGRGAYREREFLVRFRRGTSLEEQRNFAATLGVRELKPLRGKSRIVRLILGSNQTLESLAVTLQDHYLIESAEPNYLIYQDSGAEKAKPSATPIGTYTQGRVLIPNDPHFGEQWALQNLGGSGLVFGSDIQVTKVWPHVKGQRELTVAIVDSGIDFNHPDLKNQQWKNRKETTEGEDEDHNGFVDDINGWDFVKDNNNGRDENGHGTNVAGLVAAEGDNGIGIVGVLWSASLMSLRVLDADGIGDTASAIEALDYATENGAQVINLSWGTDAKSLFLMDAIRRSAK